MDNSRSNRKYPGMTLTQLQDSVASGITETRTIDIINVMSQEIADRLSGKSKITVVPQVSWS